MSRAVEAPSATLSGMTEFRNQLQDKEELVTEFSQVLWQTLIDQLIIGEGKVITVQFRDGSQIELWALCQL